MRLRTLPLGGILLSIFALSAFLLTAPGVQAADTDIVITEIMQNPAVLADAVGEWFEIHNTGASTVDIQGWTFKDFDTDSFTLPTGSPINVAAGAYAVLAVDSLTMVGQGVTVLHGYSGMALANGGDELVALNASLAPVDTVAWDGGPVWPDPTGASMQWDEVGANNNDGTHWNAPSTPTFGSGDAGTPGAANATSSLQAPVVNNVLNRPLVVEATDAPTITADITDIDGTISSATLYVQINGGGFVGQPMTLGTPPSYSATISSQSLGTVVDYYVSAMDNDGLVGSRPVAAPAEFFSYTVQNRVITPIASIHADSTGYDGTVVTVQGQVYIPGDYKQDGTTVSAYIQDGSGRGLNIFGSFLSTGTGLLNNTGNVVQVSGTVSWYAGTTVEITEFDCTLVSSGNPELTPATLSTSAAAAPSNEGTFIRSAGLITAISATGGTNPAHNFTVNDGSGPVVIRVDDDTDPSLTTWALNDSLEAAGAGATFGSDGEIVVGQLSRIINHGPGVDGTPPTLVSATLTGAAQVTVQFSEAVDATTGNNAGNYEVFEQATPANTITVNTAAVQGDASQVVLTLGSAPSSAVIYTVRVNNVEDLNSNVIAANSTTTLVDPNASAVIKINEVMQNPFVLSDSDGEWFEVYNAGSSAVDMNGWTIRDNGIDSHVINNGGPLVISPGEYKVLARNATAMAGEGVSVFYEYGTDITLGNADDEIYLVDTTSAIVDSVLWDGGTVWPDPSGASMQWDGTGDNNDGSHWYSNGFAFGSGDLGSPGAANSQDLVTAVPERQLATSLAENVPNPFNPRTSFSFTLEKNEQVSLKIYDTRGRMVRTVLSGSLKAGSYDRVYSWDGRDDAGRNAPSGIYFFRLSTESGFSQAKKMTLLK